MLTFEFEKCKIIRIQHKILFKKLENSVGQNSQRILKWWSETHIGSNNDIIIIINLLVQKHEKSYLLQFVQTNCNLFEQIVICSNKHIIICLNKLQFVWTNCNLFEQIIICLFEQITICSNKLQFVWTNCNK